MWHFSTLLGMWPARERPDRQEGETSVVRGVCRGWATLEISPSLALSTGEAAGGSLQDTRADTQDFHQSQPTYFSSLDCFE